MDAAVANGNEEGGGAPIADEAFGASVELVVYRSVNQNLSNLEVEGCWEETYKRFRVPRLCPGFIDCLMIQNYRAIAVR